MPKATVRTPMPPSRRAKQFVPFDALKGMKDAIAQRSILPHQGMNCLKMPLRKSMNVSQI